MHNDFASAKSMTFRTKIILVLIIAATFPVAVLGMVSIQNYEKEMTERINSFHKSSAALTASGINEFLQDAKRSLALSSQVIPFEQFPPADLPDALKIPYRQFDYVNIVALLTERGRLVSRPAYENAPSDIKGLEGHEAVGRKDLDRFLNNVPTKAAVKEGTAFGDTYYAAHADSPRVALAVSFPVRGGAEQWILAAEISLKSILEKIRGITPHKGGTAFIIDANGYVVCHNAEGPMRARASLKELDIVRHGQGASSTVTREYRSVQGTEMSGAFAPIETTSWGLVVAQPVDEAFAVIGRVKAITLFWICLSLVVAVLGGVLLARGVTAPVRELAKGAERIAAKDFDSEIAIQTHDEIGQLARAFNHMQGELKRSFDTITEKNNEIAKWNDELQQRVKDRTWELRQAEEQIIRSQKMAAVAELSAGIAHEINNPLTSIMGFSQLMLRQTHSDHKFNQYLKSIVSGSKRIQELVDEMLRFGRSSDNPGFTNVDLNQLLENTITMVRRPLTERRIETITELEAGLPLVNGDHAQLQQTFVHLFNNAKSAMEYGGKLIVRSEAVEGGAVKVTVKDTGKGIQEENLSKIFELFYTTKDQWNKKGFGLSVADQIIRDHGGKITVLSKIGIGTIFTIFLPGVQKSTYLG